MLNEAFRGAICEARQAYNNCFLRVYDIDIITEIIAEEFRLIAF